MIRTDLAASVSASEPPRAELQAQEHAGFIVPARLNPHESLVASNGDAARFLKALGRGGSFTFQTLDDGKQKRKWLTRMLHGTAEQHADVLHRMNQKGAGVFVVVNAGDGKGRKMENIRAVRALFVDLDGAPLAPVLDAPIPPHLVVESSPGKWHAYWIVGGVPLAAFQSMQSQLAKRFGGDRAVCDLPRLMRVPGYFHNKRDPWLSRIAELRDGPSIDYEQFVDTFSLERPVLVGERNNRLFHDASGLRQRGIPKASALSRISAKNHKLAEAPLDSAEIAQIVNNAYKYDASGFSKVPHALVDGAQFENLSPGAAKLFMYAMRRHFPGQQFALPHTEFPHIPGLKNKQSFRGFINELIDAGLLVMTRKWVAAVAQEDRQCALYRLGDWVQTVPKAAVP